MISTNYTSKMSSNASWKMFTNYTSLSNPGWRLFGQRVLINSSKISRKCFLLKPTSPSCKVPVELAYSTTMIPAWFGHSSLATMAEVKGGDIGRCYRGVIGRNHRVKMVQTLMKSTYVTLEGFPRNFRVQLERNSNLEPRLERSQNSIFNSIQFIYLQKQAASETKNPSSWPPMIINKILNTTIRKRQMK